MHKSWSLSPSMAHYGCLIAVHLRFDIPKASNIVLVYSTIKGCLEMRDFRSYLIKYTAHNLKRLSLTMFTNVMGTRSSCHIQIRDGIIV